LNRDENLAHVAPFIFEYAEGYVDFEEIIDSVIYWVSVWDEYEFPDEAVADEEREESRRRTAARHSPWRFTSSRSTMATVGSRIVV